jgi:dTDP-4-amino-4,6-dideoxygalactose transaminase
MATQSEAARGFIPDTAILQRKSSTLPLRAMNKTNAEMILQANPKAGYLAHKPEIDAEIQRVLASGYYILGPEVEAFEREFAAFVGVNHAIGVANGTDALEIALRACGVEAGDVVITVSHTAVATVAAIELVGAVPLLVDIDPVSSTMDLNCLEQAIRRVKQDSALGNLKAIIPVHIYGHPANMPEIMALAAQFELVVIEDCSQAHGARFGGRQVGTWGHLSAYSLYPTKNLGALGDAGIVVTNSAIYAERVTALRQYGWRQRFISDIAGMNSRLDPLQAAVLRVKLRHLSEENSQRQQVAKVYSAQLEGLPVKLPQVGDDIDHVFHQYVLRINNRDQVQTFLAEHGIGTAIHYPVPVHLQAAYVDRVALGAKQLPVTEQLRHEILSLPMHPHLTKPEIQRTIDGLLAWFKP